MANVYTGIYGGLARGIRSGFRMGMLAQEQRGREEERRSQLRRQFPDLSREAR